MEGGRGRIVKGGRDGKGQGREGGREGRNVEWGRQGRGGALDMGSAPPLETSSGSAPGHNKHFINIYTRVKITKFVLYFLGNLPQFRISQCSNMSNVF